MNWILIAYLLSLIVLAMKLEDPTRLNSFRKAWITFALIPMWNFLMHLFRVGNIQDTESLRLIEIWDQAIPSLLLGISLFHLLGAIAPEQPTSKRH